METDKLSNETGRDAEGAKKRIEVFLVPPETSETVAVELGFNPKRGPIVQALGNLAPSGALKVEATQGAAQAINGEFARHSASNDNAGNRTDEINSVRNSASSSVTPTDSDNT
jgi:hypothetical protein